MEENEFRKLQRYIVKRYQDQTDEQVIAHIEKLNKKDPLSEDQWEELLASACYYCCYHDEYTVFDYILTHVPTFHHIRHCVEATVRSQEKDYTYILKRINVLKRLLPYIGEEEKENILNESLLLASWYGLLGIVKFLIDQGADIHYVGKQGKNAFEYAEIFYKRFADDTLYRYLKSYYESGTPLEDMESYYGIKKGLLKKLFKK